MAGVEYLISVKDGFTPTLKKLESNLLKIKGVMDGLNKSSLTRVTNNLKKVNSEISQKNTGMATSLRGVNRELNNMRLGGAATLKNINNEIGKNKGGVGAISSGIGLGGLGLGGLTPASIGISAASAAAISLLKSSSEAAMKMDSLNAAMRTVSETSKDYRINMAFAKKLSDDLGVNFMKTADGLKDLMGGFKGTGVSAQKVRKIFEDVSIAAKGLKLDTFRQELVFRGLSQMASKGVVSMEELRQQIGESLPGALSAAAKEIGVSMPALNKAIESGTISSIEFLPVLAKSLRETFGKNVNENVHDTASELERLGNSWDSLKIKIGDGVNKFLNPLASILGKTIDFLNKNTESIGRFTFAFLEMINPLVGFISFIQDLPSLSDISNFLSPLINSFSSAKKSIVDFFDPLINGIKETMKSIPFFSVIERVISGIADAAQKAFSYISSLFKKTSSFFTENRWIMSFGIFKQFKQFVPKVSKPDAQNAIKKQKTEISKRPKTKEDIETELIAAKLKKQIDTLKAKAKGKGKGAVDGEVGTTVTSAAPKIFNINIEKQVEAFNVYSTTVEQGAAKLQEIVTRALSMALADIQPR